jgi:hypothetical protein
MSRPACAVFNPVRPRNQHLWEQLGSSLNSLVQCLDNPPAPPLADATEFHRQVATHLLAAGEALHAVQHGDGMDTWHDPFGHGVVQLGRELLWQSKYAVAEEYGDRPARLQTIQGEVRVVLRKFDRQGPGGYDAAVAAVDRWVKGVLDAMRPDTVKPETTPSISTIWFHGGQSYSTDGQTPFRVLNEQDNILKAFLDRDEALDTEALSHGVNNVSAAITKLIDRVGEGFVRRPENKGEGYFIRVRSQKQSN